MPRDIIHEMERKKSEQLSLHKYLWLVCIDRNVSSFLFHQKNRKTRRGNSATVPILFIDLLSTRESKRATYTFIGIDEEEELL